MESIQNPMSFFSFWNGEELTISDIDSQIDVEEKFMNREKNY